MKRLILRLIRFYQKYLSLDSSFWVQKLLPGLRVCRFQPTCSEYTYQAVDRYGVFRGVWRGVKRVVRCHPFSSGGSDPLV